MSTAVTVQPNDSSSNATHALVIVLVLLLCVSLLLAIGRKMSQHIRKPTYTFNVETSPMKEVHIIASSEAILPYNICIDSDSAPAHKLVNSQDQSTRSSDSSDSESPTFSDNENSSPSTSATSTQPNTPNMDIDIQIIVTSDSFYEQDITDANQPDQSASAVWWTKIPRMVKSPAVSPTMSANSFWAAEDSSEDSNSKNICSVFEADATSANFSENQLIIPGMVLNAYELSRLFA